MGLKELSKWLSYCPRCNSCKFLYRDYSQSCPAFERFKWECYTASGKVWLARDLFEGKYPLSESIRDKIFSCTLCGNCSEQCQQEISEHHQDIFEALREECVDAGLSLPVHQAFHNSIDKNNNPYGEPHDQRFAGLDAKYFKDTADIFFFVGCTTAYRNKQLMYDVLKIMDHLGVNFTLAKDEWCCGSPLFTTGQKKYAKALAEHNVELFKKMKIKTVVTACAGCFRSLKTQYTRNFGLLEENEKKDKAAESSLEVIHLSEFLERIITKKVFTKTDKIRVTYHDPCHLGRHVGVFEEPRAVIKKMKNVTLIEMPRNRKNAWCCGAGAGVKSAYKDWSLEISELRIKEAIDLQKDGKGPLKYIVSACPFCERNLSDAVESLKKKAEPGAENLAIIDLIQLVKERIGL